MYSPTAEQEPIKPRSSEKKRKSLKRTGLALILAGVTVLGTTGCSSSSLKAVSKPTTTTTQAANPYDAAATKLAEAATPSATETTAPTLNADVAFNVEADGHATYEQFITRPRAEQMAFVFSQYDRMITDAISSEYLTAVPY